MRRAIANGLALYLVAALLAAFWLLYEPAMEGLQRAGADLNTVEQDWAFIEAQEKRAARERELQAQCPNSPYAVIDGAAVCLRRKGGRP